MRRALSCMAALWMLVPAAVFAADSRYPDWPCPQIKVPEISLTAVWGGPSIEGASRTWESDPKIKDLVSRLSLRRVSIKEAEKAVAEFITGEATAKAEKAKLLFAGLYDTMQFAKADSGPVGGPREAQIMVRHPNNSGLQMDQVTRLYTPAFFIRELRVWQGDQLAFAMEGGISISEDPNIRFSYMPNGAATFRAEAIDTDGHVYKGEWPVEASAM